MSMGDARTDGWNTKYMWLTAASRLGLPLLLQHLLLEAMQKKEWKKQRKKLFAANFFLLPPTQVQYVCICVFLHSCQKSEMQHLFRDLTAVRRLSFQVSPKQCVLFLQLQNPACQVNTTHTHSETYD